MNAKAVALSVRVSAEDAEFLESLQIPSAQSASEKLRALIAEARQRREAGQSYEASLALVRELLEPVSQRLRQRELVTRQRSELLADTLYWLPDLVAFLLAGPHAGADQDEAADLSDFEAGMAHRIFHFVESMLRLGVTTRAPCYDPDVVARHLGRPLELARLILAQRPPDAPA